MEHIKKCPLFVVLMGTGLIFTLIGIVGKSNIYAGQEYDPVTTPVLALMFRAVNDDIYPWQILDGESRQVMAVKDGQENSGTAMDGAAGGDADLTQSRDEALNGGEGNTARRMSREAFWQKITGRRVTELPGRERRKAQRKLVPRCLRLLWQIHRQMHGKIPLKVRKQKALNPL